MMLVGFLPNLGPQEMLVIGVVAVLLFGKRLPEVGRSLGKSLAEFNRSVRGLQEQITSAADPTPSASQMEQRRRDRAAEVHEEATAPKFVPPSSATAPNTPLASVTTAAAGTEPAVES
ncbi:MAG: Sec-independent protein translocase subunit TatA/TatB [Planctomycetota bacterium]